MAKVPFTKLGLVKNTEVRDFEYNNNTIEVKQYLPIDEKVGVIARAVDAAASADTLDYIDSNKVDVFLKLEIVYAYTNLSFTEKQKSEATKTYDLLEGSGFFKELWGYMEQEEIDALFDGAKRALEDKVAYDRSLYAIAQVLTNDYNGLAFDAESIKSDISNPDNLNILRDVLTKLG